MKCEAIVQPPVALLLASATAYSLMFLLVAPALTALIIPVSILALQSTLIVVFGLLAVTVDHDAEPTLQLQEATVALDDLNHITIHEVPR